MNSPFGRMTFPFDRYEFSASSSSSAGFGRRRRVDWVRVARQGLSAPALCRPAAPRRCPARTRRENKQCTIEAIGGKVGLDVKIGGRTAIAAGRGHRMLRRNRLHNPLVSWSDAKQRVSNNDPVGVAIGSRRSVVRVASPTAPRLRTSRGKTLAVERRDPSGRGFRPEKSLQVLEKAQNGLGNGRTCSDHQSRKPRMLAGGPIGNPTLRPIAPETAAWAL